MPASPAERVAATGDDGEDDYMSMAIPEVPKTKETSLQKAARRKRENELKAMVKSKAEQEAEAAAAREKALDTAIDSSNKGFKMMAKLGFKPGMTLGKEGGRSEPIRPSIREDRGGIGMDTEKKRKFREAYEESEKKVKLTAEEYRERKRQENEELRAEKNFRSAQKVAETLDTEADEQEADDAATVEPGAKPKKKQKALRHINILWRGLARKRYDGETKEQARKLMQGTLSRLPTYDDPDETEEDKFAGHTQEEFEVEVDEEDPELDEFNALPASERLEKLVMYLRNQYHYCFWCGYRYPDAEMDGCPGTTEADHD